MNGAATIRVMALGLLFAMAFNLPLYSWIFAKHWHWAEGWPLYPFAMGLGYMSTFFHEIGHTIFMWFYGYPTVPLFDFKYGGGWALALTDQQILLMLMVCAALGYGIYFFRGALILQIVCGLALLLNLSLGFTEYHHAVIDFMGPGFEPLVAGFLLFRALFDLAPRGGFERFLNALFGFAMILSVLINGYGLMKSQAWRLLYYEQKGAHGFGDFDKVADRLLLDFNTVVTGWMGLALLCLALPFMLYALWGRTAD